MTAPVFGYTVRRDDRGGFVAECATMEGGDTYAAPDRSSLLHYLENYDLCGCGNHGGAA